MLNNVPTLLAQYWQLAWSIHMSTWTKCVILFKILYVKNDENHGKIMQIFFIAITNKYCWKR